MIYGHLSIPSTYEFLRSYPYWKMAFDWLGTVTPNTPVGIHKLVGDQVYANVHGYQTVPPEQTRYESHRRYVDLQYCISGGELIACQFADHLQPDGAYDPSKDVSFYRAHPQGTILCMAPGDFAVFFPADAHAPKQFDGSSASVLKAVVKIAYS